jgi:hypothetical protein
MRNLYIDNRFKHKPNYIGSFKGLYDTYTIWKNNDSGVSLFYSDGGFYSNTNLEDINQWLQSLGYIEIKFKNYNYATT